MKRIMMMLLLALATMGANAQWKVGKTIKKIPNYDIWDDKYVLYKENRNGTFSIFCCAEGAWYEYDTYSRNYLNYIKFTGFYKAEITDPRDDYVNVRKGPGTNYPVVGKLSVGDEIFYKKTSTNWLEVYTTDSELYNGFFMGPRTIGYMYPTEGATCFIGYIYKDRVKSPSL